MNKKKVTQISQIFLQTKKAPEKKLCVKEAILCHLKLSEVRAWTQISPLYQGTATTSYTFMCS